MTKEQLVEESVSRRIIPLTGKIREGIADELKASFFRMALEDSTIPAHLVVDSGGGDIIAALSIYDIIKGIPFEVHATVVGKCHSAALLVLAACKKRRATLHSRFLFHAMRSGDEIASTKDIERQVKEIVRRQTMLKEQGIEIESKAFGIPKEELQRMMIDGEDFNIQLSAQEAREKGIIHEIIEKFDFLK